MGIEELLLDRAKQQGKQEGKLEGKLEGKHEQTIAMAIELKKEGLSLEFIAKITHLSIEELEKL